MTNTLLIDSLFCKIGAQHILNGVYLRFQTGEVVGLLGRNGSGKSTILKCISGEISRKQMTLKINDQCVASCYESSIKAFCANQAATVPGWLTVAELYELFEVDKSKVADFLLAEKIESGQKLFTLSVGLKKLVYLLALVHSNAAFVLLDEPFAGLSPKSVEFLLEEIESQKTNKGFLLIDHDYRTLMNHCTSVYLLNHGRLSKVESLENLVDGMYIRG